MQPLPDQLIDEEIHVWRASLEWSPQGLTNGFQTLSEEERKQADRFIQAKHRDLFIASHAILHDILSQYVSIPPDQIRFRRTAHGKPYLDHPTPIRFNMSDSEEYALYAVTLERDVGVDIEFMRENIHPADIVERFFSRGECEAFQQLPESERFTAFYRCWALKEAFIKCVGEGLSFHLQRFSVDFQNEGMQCLLEVDHSKEKAKAWSLGNLEVPQKYQAAVACQGPIKSVKFFEYS